MTTINDMKDVVEWCTVMFNLYKNTPTEEVTYFMEGELYFAVTLYERITGTKAPFIEKEVEGRTTYSYLDETIKNCN